MAEQQKTNTQEETIVERIEDVGAEIEKVGGDTTETKSRIPLMVAAALILVVGGGIAAAAYLSVSNQQVYIENSNVMASSIPLAPNADGTLQDVYVSVGDTIPANTVVAQVGTELIKSTIGGLVIST